MPKKKKKNITGSTGRFGPRYGTRVRARVKDVDDQIKAKHTCPKCEAEKVTRVGSGVWKCERCGAEFTGKAYTPETRSVQKQIAEEVGASEASRNEEQEE